MSFWILPVPIKCWTKLITAIFDFSTEPPHLPPHLRKIILNHSSSQSSRRPQDPESAPSTATNNNPVPKNEDSTELAVVCLLAVMLCTAFFALAHLLSRLIPQANHVTLNHLYCTAMKHGLMVLGTTFRYKQKCVTTVYYSVASNSSKKK